MTRLFLTILIKLLLGLISLLVEIRIVGKRSFSKIIPYDLIYTLVLAGSITPGL
ncbi:hypothetical protein [Priestia megaterium]|uniref:hypothetical protein n=1 Tax=Priestia megaterium TaxID=1404 RepID=UPI0035A12AD5